PRIAIALDEAGIADLRYPITVHLADGGSQSTVAIVAIAAGVASDARGVHMSRFVESLHAWRDRIAVSTLLPFLNDVRDRLDATSTFAKLNFPLFLERGAPVSGGTAFLPYDCLIEASLGSDGGRCEITTLVPITSLCPCSREISDY